MVDYAKWYTRKFGTIQPEWYVFAFGRPSPSDPARPMVTPSQLFGPPRRRPAGRDRGVLRPSRLAKGGHMNDRQIRMCIDRFVPDPVRSDVEADALAARPDNLRLEPIGGGPLPARMAVVVSALWPTGEQLKVRFLDGEESIKGRVEERAREWMDHANIAFEFGDDPAADIRISFQQEGSWSYLGLVAREIPRSDPTMNYGWLTPDSDDDEVSRVVLHEFGHALGAIHEHQNPDVEIPWDKEAVYAYYARQGWSRTQVDRNLFEAYSREGIRNSRFDRDSIMLYAVDNALTIGDWEVGWNRILSAGDKAFMAAQYPSEEKVVPALDPSGMAFFLKDTATTEIYTRWDTLALHGALPI
jgi:hypothetical protein